MCPILISAHSFNRIFNRMFAFMFTPYCFYFFGCKYKYKCFNWKYSEVFRLAECQHQHYLLLASYVWVKSGRPLCGWTLPGPSRWRLPLGPHRSCWAPVPSAPRSLGRQQVRAIYQNNTVFTWCVWFLLFLTFSKEPRAFYFFVCIDLYNPNTHKCKCPH